MQQVFRVKGFAFDLDGTLIDTTPLVEQHWRDFALEYGLDAEKVSVPFRLVPVNILMETLVDTGQLAWSSYD